jgi:hypothetical protein
MTDQHPITPPPELRQLWAQQAQRISPHDPVEWMQYVSEKAAQWGADQELEACRMEIIDGEGLFHIEETSDRVCLADDLRAARRPKPPSLKKEACDALDAYIYGNPDHNDKQNIYNTIRRALEALSDG